MRKVLGRILLVLLALLVVLIITGAALWPGTVRASFPQTEGEIKLPGLDAPVDVYRDELGIPQIYASSEHDLFFAQGYIHAQDRFWQMDFQRHASAGRMSELVGSAGLDVDLFLRTMGWERIARQELANIDPAALAVLQAYADGVNAYLADREGTELSLEYLFLGLLNRGYQPEPWTPLNTLTWAKAMAWDLRGNMDDEIQRAILSKTLSAEQIEEIYPPYPEDHPYIVNDLAPFTSGETSSSASPILNTVSLSALEEVAGYFASLDGLLGNGPDSDVGSNSWAVSGELTATGMPILANDPHLSAAIPHIWYEVGLHCQPKGPDCPLDLAGFSFVGAPGIVIGHNDHIAWGFTNVGPDVMDLYVEKINPNNPDQYEVNGEWVDMDIVTENITVAGKDPVELTVRLTRHGPIISDTYGGLEDFGEKAGEGVDLPENYAIALRWTSLEPNYTLGAVLNFNRATNWEEFRQAASGFAVPAQNLLYADVEGNIGYQMPGNIPIRAGGADGRYPVPGWTDDYEWLGYIPFEELPYSFNPPEGYIVTANNAVVSEEYPYQIADRWAPGYRAQRIVDMIINAPGLIDPAYIQKMQGDDYNINAEELLPYLMALSLDDEDLIAAREILDGWDHQQTLDSAPAALYNAFWKQLLDNTFHDDLPEDYWPGGSSNWFVVYLDLVNYPNSPWWDDQSTPEVEDMDAILALSFADAVEEMRSLQGRDPAKWSWGDLHTLTFEHAIMSNFPLINRVFERGPYPLAGGSSIVNNTNWDAASGDFTQRGSSPSLRMIVDLSNLANSLAVIPTGESGHAQHPHYIDMIDLWRLIEYHPMLWDRTAVQSAAESHLRLTP